MKQASLFLLLALVAAGCSGKAGDGFFHADASAPVLMAPPATPLYGYDGAGMAAGTGTMTVHVSNAANQGYVRVDFTAGGHRYQVNWTDFHIQPGQAWQDGGIACGPGLVEHGASGHGNKMEPQFDLDCGGWGTASALLDGKPLTDPVTGATAFNAHFMVTKEAMLEPGTMRVDKTDGKTPFDPHTPGDGHVFAGRKEAHFALWGVGAYQNGIAVQPPAANVTTVGDTAIGAMYAKSFPIPVAAVQGSLGVHVALTGGVGNLALALKDPTGNTVASGQLSPTATGADLVPAGSTLSLGAYTLEVTGAGAQAAYQATITQHPPTPLLVHVVFTSVTEG